MRDPALRASAVVEVADAGRLLGWFPHGVARSPLPGPSGNGEFFLWMRRQPATALDDEAIGAAVTASDSEEPR